MKVLIVSFAFPPSNVIGAVRVGKLARYLDRRGHDVRVLATDLVEDRSLPLEILRERVFYTEYRQRQHWIDRWLGLACPHSLPGRRSPRGRAAQDGAPARSLWQTFRRHYFGLIHIPDMRTDWIRTAIPAGRQLIKEWKPEIIFASAPPNTGLMVASRLARAHKIPWVADFRDLWVDNPYYSEPGWRKRIDAILERRILRRAAGLVTVSPIWAEQLRRRHGKDATVVYNGYAQEDFPPVAQQANPEGGADHPVYGLDLSRLSRPSALFSAIALLPDHATRLA